MTKDLYGTVAWSTLAKPFFVSGFSVTVLLFPAYALDKWSTMPAWAWALLFVFAPFINGAISVLTLSVGYPVYSMLARRRKFDVHVVKVLEQIE